MHFPVMLYFLQNNKFEIHRSHCLSKFINIPALMWMNVTFCHIHGSLLVTSTPRFDHKRQMDNKYFFSWRLIFLNLCLPYKAQTLLSPSTSTSSSEGGTKRSVINTLYWFVLLIVNLERFKVALIYFLWWQEIKCCDKPKEFVWPLTVQYSHQASTRFYFQLFEYSIFSHLSS